MIWILLLLLHLVGNTAYTLLLRRHALGSIDKYALAALMQTAIWLPAVTWLGISGGFGLGLAWWQWASLAASGGLIVLIQLATIKVLQMLPVSIWTIIFTLRLGLATLLAFVFLHELPTPLQGLGGFIIFLSILALNLHKERRFAQVGILFGLAATVIYSIHVTVEKFNLTYTGLLPYSVVAGGIATLILWLCVLARRVPASHVRTHLDGRMWLLLAMRILSAWAYMIAVPLGSLAAANYISGMGVVLIVGFGVLFLGEREQLREKIVAVGIAVIGLTLILIGRLTGL